MKEVVLKIPSNWRKGQGIFNFLEFLKQQGVEGNQNTRLADTFFMSDKDWDKYVKKFNKL